MSFQARPFYERAGYGVVGALRDGVEGHSRYVMRKALDAGADAGGAAAGGDNAPARLPRPHLDAGIGDKAGTAP